MPSAFLFTQAQGIPPTQVSVGFQPEKAEVKAWNYSSVHSKGRLFIGDHGRVPAYAPGSVQAHAFGLWREQTFY